MSLDLSFGFAGNVTPVPLFKCYGFWSKGL